MHGAERHVGLRLDHAAKLNASTGSYSIQGRGNIITFVFAGGTLNTIELFTCKAYQDC